MYITEKKETFSINNNSIKGTLIIDNSFIWVYDCGSILVIKTSEDDGYDSGTYYTCTPVFLPDPLRGCDEGFTKDMIITIFKSLTNEINVFHFVGFIKNIVNLQEVNNSRKEKLERYRKYFVKNNIEVPW